MLFRREDRDLARLKRMALQIWKLGPSMRLLSDSELAVKSDTLKARAEDEPLGSILPEAYALVREVAHRTVAMRPYEEQIMGAIALHEGKIIEMANGEGKTLTATMPAYLNSLSGQGVHIATYNDYLARRDAQWMGPIYATLGLSVGVIQPDGDAYRLDRQDEKYALVSCSRKDAYACDITYGTHRDFGFDYLRDNMVWNEQELVQDSLDYIILDEADSVLIDLAQTPLIVSRGLPCNPEFYRTMLIVAKDLRDDVDFVLYPRFRYVEFTYEGIRKAEELLGIDSLYSVEHAGIAHQLLQSIRALSFYAADRDYVVKDGQVILVDEYTGRLMPGNTFSDGLHQAVQAKEGLEITPEGRALAKISYQHFFRLYRKMAGMTATAKWREDEFYEVYGTRVVVILTHKPVIRKDLTDLVFSSITGKLPAMLREIRQIHITGRPILIGTHTIEEAKLISRMLKARLIDHQVLHAKNQEREAGIIESAGQKGAVTIAAKMAGRGTNIRLGKGVAELGGLHVVGAERYESRHMDLHLRGRAGRQGDPGSSRFFLSLDSDLMVRFGGLAVQKLMQRFNVEEVIPIEHALVTRSIESAQRKVEEYDSERRQQAYEFDSVLDKQRKFTYAIRRKAVLGDDLSGEINTIMDNVVTRAMERHMADKRRSANWDTEGLSAFICGLTSSFKRNSFTGLRNQKWDDIKDWLLNTLHASHEKRRSELGEDDMTLLERLALIRHLDRGWEDHLHRLEVLQQEMNLRSHVEEDPLEWYTMKSNQAFWEMIEQVEVGFLNDLFKGKIKKGEESQ